MPGFDSFLTGFFDTGSKKVLERNKEKRKAKLDKETRAQKNADELDIFMKKTKFKAKTDESAAVAKAKRERDELASFDDRLGINPSSPQGEDKETLNQLNDTITEAYRIGAPKSRIDLLEHKRDVMQEFNKVANAPVGATITDAVRKQNQSMWGTQKPAEQSPLFPEGSILPQTMSAAELKNRGRSVGEKEVTKEGNVYTLKAKATLSQARREVNTSMNRVPQIGVYINKQNGDTSNNNSTTLGLRENDKAGRIELALNTLEYATTDADKTMALKQLSSAWKDAMPGKKIKLDDSKAQFFLTPTRIAKIREAKELLAPAPIAPEAPLAPEAAEAPALTIREQTIARAKEAIAAGINPAKVLARARASGNPDITAEELR